MANKTSAMQAEPTLTESVPDQRAGSPATPHLARIHSAGAISDGENKALPQPPSELPEGVGSGKRSIDKPKPEQSAWHRALSRAIAIIRRQWGPIDSAAADRLTRCFRAMLLPRRPPGRKPSREVALATTLRRQGLQWRDIYPKALVGYASMPFYERNCRCYNLRRAVAARLKRQQLRERKQRQDESARENV